MFGLTPQGLKIKRLADIKLEIETRLKGAFGASFDLSPATPEGQIVGLQAERESLIWELAQETYDSQYPITAEDRPLDNAVSLTGTVRKGASKSRVIKGVARGENGTVIPKDTIISVEGNSNARFLTKADAIINVVDGLTFKSDYIELIAESVGPIQANTGTLKVIETPTAGLESFINEEDAILGSEIESNDALKARRDQELQIAGSATPEAIRSELLARPLVTAAIVFQNIYSIPDLDGRPPKSLDIVVQGDDEDDLAEAIFLVVGGGIETIGDVEKTVIDSQGFNQTIKFSRPTNVPIWIEYDLTVDNTIFPADGLDQAEAAILAYAENFTVGQDVIVFGYKSLIGVFNNIPGITDVELRIGKFEEPILNQNIVIAPREIAEFDSGRILGTVL